MNKHRVLIIDDEADLVTLLSKALHSRGYEVMTAANGWDGLTLARIEKPDLILLDCLMPKMDGPTMLSSLRAMKETGNIPVVMITALSGKEHVTDALKNGAADYIVKPFDFDVLLKRISRVLKSECTTGTHASAVPCEGRSKSAAPGGAE
jgi:DNA-binding response OmpR family regulator